MVHSSRVPALVVTGLVAALTLGGIPGDASSSFARATPRGKAACPAGWFLDLFSGNCARCPPNYERSLIPGITLPTACVLPARAVYQRATRRARGTGFIGSDCPKGQFWDPNGYCYTCPSGYSALPLPVSVTDPKKCMRLAPATYAQATIRALCPAGSFLDVGRGDCWSCPANWHRTVSPVDGPQACSSDVAGIFAIDSTAMCADALAAFGAGKEAQGRLMSALKPILDPLAKPIDDAVSALSKQISTPAELKTLRTRVVTSFRSFPNATADFRRISALVPAIRARVERLLLDPKMVCGGDLTRLGQELAGLGLRPTQAARAAKPPAPGVPFAFVQRAPAAAPPLPERRAFVAVGGSITIIAPKPPPVVISLTVITDGVEHIGLFLSGGISTGSAQAKWGGLGSPFGFMIFPSATFDDFVTKIIPPDFSLLAAQVDFTPGEKFPELFGEKAEPVNLSISVSFEPITLVLGQSVPGIGANWSWGTEGATGAAFKGAYLEISGSYDGTVRLIGR